ncbi:hypothetical protein [Nocardia abscessus]|uniref:hypothetical protein n=1 Tax=Nocardia abscessus TaxID=120957 RepID=UPI00245459E6|nr:hypothetical protein [Nocardia abscessus]
MVSLRARRAGPGAGGGGGRAPPPPPPPRRRERRMLGLASLETCGWAGVVACGGHAA